MNNSTTDFKSGFISIIGAPNVGKSTLLNKILGEKISITSDKPQTTRNRILGILHRPSAQFVFMDTPGVHKARNVLNTRIVDVALSAMSGTDMILIVADVTNPDPASETIIVERLKKQNKPVILALNKTDLVLKPLILPMIDLWAAAYPFETIVPISAEKGDQIKELLDEMEARLPIGPPYYPEDSITDIPERDIAAEMVREKIFRFTGQEIPYATAVTIDSFSEEIKIVKIHATIHVERDSQKGIIIGKGGTMLKKIGEEARREIERMVGTKVFLKLFVRVQKNWSKDTKTLIKFGY